MRVSMCVRGRVRMRACACACACACNAEASFIKLTGTVSVDFARMRRATAHRTERRPMGLSCGARRRTLYNRGITSWNDLR